MASYHEDENLCSEFVIVLFNHSDFLMPPSIFKACDIRGLYGSQLDEPTAYAAGCAAGSEIDGGAVVLGGDVRPSTPALKKAVAEGLAAAGCKVLDIGIVPTPVAYFAKRFLQTDHVVIVTASHNPPEYNGIKLMLNNQPTIPAGIGRLVDRIDRRDYREGNGSIEAISVRDAYHAWLSEEFGDAFGRPLRVLVDAGNGCYADWAPPIIDRLGHDVVPLHCTPDGRFPDRDPNPAVLANLERTCDVVRDVGVDLAVAFDGDGDRVVLIDELGRPVEADRLGVFFVHHVLHHLDSVKVVYDLKCSDILRREVDALGGQACMERSGHSFIRSRMMAEQAHFGVEISGHIFFRELDYGDDGLYTALLAARICSHAERPLSQLIDDIPVPIITRDIRVHLPEDIRAGMVEQFRAAFPDLPATTVDGVRLDWPDGWALCRASVTEPVITLRFEADTLGRLKELLGDVGQAIPELTEALAAESDQL